MTDPGPPPLGITGIVLAGGRSERFGSDKLVVDVDGRPLLHLAIAGVAAVAGRIVVVAAPGGEPALPGELASRIAVVHDPEAFGGPLVGLAAALRIVDAPTAVIAGGDMPRMVPAVLARLAGAIDGSTRAVTLEVPGWVQPLPMALDVSAARAAAAAVLERGGRSMRDLLRELGAASIPASAWRALDPTGATIVDIDRPGDLGS